MPRGGPVPGTGIWGPDQKLRTSMETLIFIVWQGWKRVRRRTGFTGVQSLHAKEWRAQLTTAKGLGCGEEERGRRQSLQLPGQQGTQVSGVQQGWNRGCGGQATLKWGSLAFI